MRKATLGVRGSRGPKLLATVFSLAVMLLVIAPAPAALASGPPTATQVGLSPSSPKTDASVTASTVVTDPDGADAVSADWLWQVTRGGNTCDVRSHTTGPDATPSAESDFLDLSVDQSTSSCTGGPLGTINVSRGDLLTLSMTPWDSSDGPGTPQIVSTTIVNSAPSLDSAAINEASPRTNDTLTTSLGATHDADGDAVSPSYQWQKSGGSGFGNIPGASGSTLDLSVSGNGNKGDKIRVVVTPGDGQDNGTPVNSNEVTIGNSGPTANAQSVNTDEDVAKTITLTSSDPDNDNVDYLISSLPANGVLYDGTGTGGHRIVAGDLPYMVADASHNVTFAPSLNYVGPDSFAFRVRDPNLEVSSDATVSITVAAVNDAPVAQNDTAGPVPAGTPVLINVTANDSPGGGADEAGQTLTVTSPVSPQPAHGSAVVIGNQIQYTSNITFSGTETFNYEVCDNGTPSRCSSAQVSVQVTGSTLADVSVNKSGPAAVRAGAQYDYTITVDDIGPATATGVQVTDVLPLTQTYIGSSNSGSFNPGTRTVTWNLGSITEPQAPVVLTLTVRAATTRLLPYDNTAHVSTTSTDPSSGNNDSTSHTTIETRDVVFVSNRSGDPDIWAMYDDGSAQVDMTSNAACDKFPAWSSDGTKIAFATNRDGIGAGCTGNMEIYVMNADGSNVIRLTNQAGLDVQPTWSPDDLQIAYSSQNGTAKFNVFKRPSDGTGSPVKLTKKVCNDGSRGCSPDWSPGGATIAFVRVCAAVQKCPTTAEIDTMPAAAAGAMVQLTSNAVDEGSPTWSPNGQRISIHRYDGKDFEIAMLNPDGTRQAFLTADPASDQDPSWLPSGTQIVYSSTRSGNGDIYLKNLAGPSSALTPLTTDPGADTDPDYNPA